MIFAPRAGAGPLVRSFTGVIAIAVLLAMLALPAAADDGGPVRLSHALVTPDRGTHTTTFTFNVTYRHRRDLPPEHVVAVIGGTVHRLVPNGDGWERGVTFSVQTTLPAGVHAVVFAAVDANGRSDTTAGGRISVAAPLPPVPTLDPVPDRVPEPQPTPTPPPAAPEPQPTPTPPPAAPEPQPTPTPPPAAPDPDPTPAPSAPAVVVDPTATPDPSPIFAPRDHLPPAAAAPDDPPAGPRPNTGGPGEASAGLPGNWGHLNAILDTLGLDPAASPYVRLVPVMVTTTGGVAIAMAFGFFGKRRRDGEPPEPDEVLSSKAARGTGEAATAALVPDGAALPTPFDLEAAMPRWRRPSLLQARKTDPLRSGVVPARLSFDNASVAPIDGYERRLIRYLVVQLLDTPDEFRGSEVGALAQGDEVQLLERSGTYWRVLCPDGSAGWIHRMTLGDVVGEPPSPSARETWATASVAADDVDDDVLVAFMTARGRA